MVDCGGRSRSALCVVEENQNAMDDKDTYSESSPSEGIPSTVVAITEILINRPLGRGGIATISVAILAYTSLFSTLFCYKIRVFQCGHKGLTLGYSGGIMGTGGGLWIKVGITQRFCG